MSRVYVTSETYAEPGARDVLARLGEAGHEVVVVSADGSPASGQPTAGNGPDAAGAPGWLITTDPRACGRRSPAVRTILVGPRLPTPRGPVARCDVEARDLSTAVLEILSREAMG